ncbi:hypothetical protein F8388_003458 [Cannabis sativa]|uniref:Agenet domain-containing protein n=1 Tax=Cannabis sativa TaxID=3483 RepID=A0A7J6F7G0_CANSA|nr:hypothetical protein F8388_003458 [Cannabis sativa]KAF4380481.1 hypothetical protein G4B88_011727 [Cannabis sativa]
MAVRDLPFKVGASAESRSFSEGFRGAWFRCKIKDNIKGKRQKLMLEYIDFPGEAPESILLYQKCPTKTGKLQQKKEIMLRPPFPTVYRESEMPDVNTISEVAVVFKDVRKIGDLVDWFTDSCYWSGRVIQILEDDMVEIELHPPPIGEGDSYKAFCKDLRPSLDWSSKCGWTVPTSLNSKHDPCARILKPVNQGRSSTLLSHSASEDTAALLGVDATSQSSLVSHASSNSSQPFDKLEENEKSALSLTTEKEVQTSVTDVNSDMANNGGIGKIGCADDDLISHAKSTPNGVRGTNVSPILNSLPDQLEGTETQLPSTIIANDMLLPGKDMNSDTTADSGLGRTNCSDNDANSHVKYASDEIGGTTSGKDRFDDGGSSKKMRIDGNIPPTLLFSNTMEAAIVNLEELVNCVKWMKSSLQNDMPSSDIRPSWKFLAHHASSSPKCASLNCKLTKEF